MAANFSTDHILATDYVLLFPVYDGIKSLLRPKMWCIWPLGLIFLSKYVAIKLDILKNKILENTKWLELQLQKCLAELNMAAWTTLN